MKLSRRAFLASATCSAASLSLGAESTTTGRPADKSYARIKLGISCIRINTGRWNTVDFDTLMANRGLEPILAGHTEEEGFKWCIDGIQRCLPKAQECGVLLALENHWGLARTPEGLLRIVNAI